MYVEEIQEGSVKTEAFADKDTFRIKQTTDNIDGTSDVVQVKLGQSEIVFLYRCLNTYLRTGKR